MAGLFSAVVFTSVMAFFMQQGIEAKPQFGCGIPFGGYGGYGSSCGSSCGPQIQFLPVPQPTPIPIPIRRSRPYTQPQSVTIPNIILALLPPKAPCSKPIPKRTTVVPFPVSQPIPVPFPVQQQCVQPCQQSCYQSCDSGCNDCC